MKWCSAVIGCNLCSTRHLDAEGTISRFKELTIVVWLAVGWLLCFSQAMAETLFADAESFDIQKYVVKEFFRENVGDPYSVGHMFFLGNRETHDQGVLAGNPRYCKNYVVLDFGSEIDGPLYYLNKNDGSVFSVCGGACMRDWSKPKEDPLICNECPPKNLDCNDTCPTLYCSISNNDLSAASRLIKQGANVNEIIDSNINFTLLHLAVRERNDEIIKILVENGADVNARTSDGKTALMLSIVSWAEPDNVKFLLDNGADPTLKYDFLNEKLSQKTLLEYAHNWVMSRGLSGARDMKQIIELLQQAEINSSKK